MQESVNILGTEYKIITVPGDDMGIRPEIQIFIPKPFA